ncbi:MAG: RsmB/NOP family class I SAM-dependent RNA methyltransferase [Candidatus Diapherotrites archaeon]
MVKFSPLLLNRYRELLPQKEDFDSFCHVSKTYWPKTLRVNTLKATPEWVRERLNHRKVLFEQIEGHPHTFFLKDVSRAGLIGSWWEVQAGFFHPQEWASQLPSYVLNPQPGEMVLDMAAAPGNKTIQLASHMNNTGSILAVEPNKARAKALRFMLSRGGVINTAIALEDASTLSFSHSFFDKVLLDAPCSGEGLLRKKPQTLKSWSEKYVQHKARLQEKLLLKAADLVRPGGKILYSVCTLSPEECEGVITHLLRERSDFSLLPITIPHFSTRPGLTVFRNRTFADGMEKVVRIYPQDSNTQSFFMAFLLREGKK